MAHDSTADMTADIMSPLLTATVPQHVDNESFHHGDFCRTPVRNGHDTSDQLLQMSPTPDLFELKNDNKSLKTKLRQALSDVKGEQDTVSSLRRRMNNMERERLDAVSSANQEVSRLEGDVAKYRSQLEKGEAVRQSLEFELAKANRELNAERRATKERDSMLNESHESLKQRMIEINGHVDHLTSELEATKSSAAENTLRLQSIIAEKEQLISSAQTERDITDSEKVKLEGVLEQQENAISEFEERIQELEDDKRSQLESLHRHVAENELLSEKEKRLKLDLEAANDKIKTLEESIEAERAAHLETKFNSEIVQLRIRDLESALDIEKKAKTDVISATDKLNKQLRTEKEHAFVNKHLHGELEEKKRIISKLSEQLDVHQNEFTELKQELNKTRKKQIVLEESFSGSTKEIQILVDNFRMDSKPVKGKKTATKKREPSKTQLISRLLEEMRAILIDYKRKLDETTGDNARLKQQNEHIVGECSQYKEMLWAKDKTVETMQQNFTRTSKDLRKLQSECKERDPVVKQLQQELEEAIQLLQSEQKQTRELKEQLTHLTNKYQTDELTSAEFLHSLFKQLQIVQQTPKSPDLAVQGWGDLAIAVNDQVVAMINHSQKLDEKVRRLEKYMNNKDNSLLSLQKTHEDQLEKLAGIAESRTQQWQQQKTEMENHYAQLLSEIHGRHKKTQSLADQAWEKIRMSGGVQQGLEAECAQLRGHLADCRKEHAVLLTACALLTGAFYPLYTKNVALAAERQMMTDQLARFDNLKQEVQVLVDALSIDQEMRRKTPKGRKMNTSHPLLRFRAGVIAVMGANRLMHGLRNKSSMFVVDDVLPGMRSMTVCTGGLEPAEKPFAGASNRFVLEDEKSVSPPEEFAISWLGSSEFLSTILATVGDLQSAVEKGRAGEANFDSKKLINIAKSTFRKLVYHLPTNFPSLPSEPHGGLREKSSLVRFLSHGLNRALAHTSLDGQPTFSCSQNTISALQNHILEFTERLHTVEVERRDLRIDVSRLNKELQAFEETSDIAQHLRGELIGMRHQVEHMVTSERFEAVCQEMNQALRREQQAQTLLNEQSRQIHDLGLELDVKFGESGDKANELTRALKREQQAQNIVTDQSKQILTLGMQVENLRADIKRKDKTMSAEEEACQSLISKYVTSEKQLASKVGAMNDEIQQQKQHITALKGELAAACKREYEDEIESLKLNEYQYSNKDDTPSRSAFWQSTTKDGTFEALHEDDTLPTKLTPKGKVRSQGQMFGSPEYRTPQQTKQALSRRKSGKGK